MSELEAAGGHPALTDETTGLPNRLHFDTVYQVLFQAGDRGVPVTVALVDLDGFEEYVQEEGEGAGEELLRETGGALRSIVRLSDLPARLEGDRFAVLLMDCNLAGGRVAAERFQSVLAPVLQERGVTVSIGIATYRDGMEEARELLDAAEGALLMAKGAGGDQVEMV